MEELEDSLALEASAARRLGAHPSIGISGAGSHWSSAITSISLVLPIDFNHRHFGNLEQ